MDTALFTLGAFPVTYSVALIAAAIAALAIMFALLVSAMRASTRRVEVLAEQAAEQLKSSFLAQIAERGRVTKQVLATELVIGDTTAPPRA